MEHEIELLPNKKIPNRKPYRLTPGEMKALSELVNELLEKNFIKPSSAPYASPVLLVKKPNGTYRLAIDYRAINAITIKENFPIPVIDDLLAKIGKATVFSTLDLKSGSSDISQGRR